ncbi:MAG: CTP synthase [Candidatus Fraserbacteria bacterium RBG_16_55_9]|uniref:CTP synthase n=1 Tax=Fraserbacteria sp. (strain RBG_16_55_9) TaxID=1817864 RepID=A0A1F5V267_FRAXR|nr:MAG: CTP synthase [Candidatus Fraserbacteria bacterium RBG_16_55_9]
MTKFLFVTGGVLSGLGKGVSSASIGLLLKARGIKVTAIKIDPYLNCDAGTMNPYQHGEVFVLEDGGEVDMDLGSYERFLDVNLTSDHNITTGKVYKRVIERERRGEYLGQTVQIIPHITDEIKSSIRRVAEKSGADVMIVELGGTVGDIESMPFLEAARQMHQELGHENTVFIHTTLVPMVITVGEQKTKPTQHSVKELRAIGIQPDVIVGRSDEPLKDGIKRKIALFCDVPLEAVISAPDVDLIYQVPLVFEEQGLTDYLLNRLKLRIPQQDLNEWKMFLKNALHPESRITVALVGKYTDLKDSYVSYAEALTHAAASLRARVDIQWIEADFYRDELLEGVDGLIVPVGFGHRGAEGKVQAIQYARTHSLPFLGICYGFQLSVVEFCRHVLGLKGANSTEFEEQPAHPVICLMPEQATMQEKGATMRLGAQPVMIERGTLAHRLYGATEISERHRHRYEVNPEYIKQIEEAGFVFSGKSPDGRRMEIGEIPDHPFFIASQFHPEFKSHPTKPRPLFVGLVQACLAQAHSDATSRSS